LKRAEESARQAQAALLLVVDQLEELFTIDRIRPADRLRFADALAALARSGKTRVLATLRSDFYPQFAQLKTLAELKEGLGQYDLEPPTPAEIGQMIRQPAVAAALQFEENAETGEKLDDALRDAAVRDPASLPLLEFTLDELYLRKTDRGVLTFAAYRELGGVEGALAQCAARTFDQLPPAVQAELPAIFRELVMIGGTALDTPTRRQAPLSVFAHSKSQAQFVQAFVAARLFVSDQSDDETPIVRVTHESLISRWDRLQVWLIADKELLRVRGRVAAAASRWTQEGRRADLVLPAGKPLQEALELDRSGFKLETAVVDFVAASRRRASRNARLRRAALIGLVVLTLSACGFAITAEWQRHNAETATRSLITANTNLDVANGELKDLVARNGQLLKDESWQRSRAEWELYRGHIDAALRGIKNEKLEIAVERLDSCRWELRGWEYYHVRQQIDGARLVFSHLGPFVHGLAFSADGARLAAGTGSDIHVWDTAGGRTLQRYRGHTGQINALVFADDGSYLVSAGNDKTAWVWDREGEGRKFTGHKSEVLCIAISPDGKSVASADISGMVLIWNPSTMKVLREDKDWLAVGPQQPIHKSRVVGITFLPGGREVLSVGSDGRLVRRPPTPEGGETTEALPFGVGQTAVSPDRSWLALQGPLVDGKTKIFVRKLAPQGPKAGAFAQRDQNERVLTFNGAAHEMALSAAGTWLAVLNDGRDAVHFLNRETGKRDHLIYSKSRTGNFGLALSSRGTMLAVGDEGAIFPSEVRVWDVQAELGLGRHRNARDTLHSSDYATTDVVVGGGLLAMTRGFLLPPLLAANREVHGSIEIWDFPKLGEKSRAYIPERSQVLCVALGQENRLLACGLDSGEIRLRDSADGRLRSTFGGQNVGAVHGVAFEPAGSRLAAGGEDGSIRLWDVAAGTEIRKLEGHAGPVKAVAYSPNGRLIASGGSDSSVRIWDVETGRELRTLRGHGATVNTVAFSPDGQWLATGSADATTSMWDVGTGVQLWVERETFGKRLEFLGIGGDARQVLKIAFTPDGRRVVSQSGVMKIAGLIRLRDSATGQLAATLEETGAGGCLSVSSDGRHIVSADKDGYITAWSTPDAAEYEPRLLRAAAQPLQCCAASTDGRLLAVGAGGLSLELYDASTGQISKSIKLDGPAACVAFHPRDQVLAYRRSARTIAVRDLAGVNDTFDLNGHEDDVVAVAFSTDGALLATGSKDKTARIWDTAGGNQKAVMTGHDGRVAAVVFLPDGETLATGSWDGQVRLWDIASRTVRKTIDAHDEGVSSIALSSDGKFLVSGSLEGAVKVWDLGTARELYSLKVHTDGAVSGVAVLADDATGVSTGADGTALVWDLGTGRILRRLWLGGDAISTMSLDRKRNLLLCGCKDGGLRVWKLDLVAADRRRYVE
jgi:WD40 repeat protein